MAVFALFPASAQQYRADKAGPPPADLLAPAIAQSLEKTGFAISTNGSPYCELWLRANVPSIAATGEPNITLTSVPVGSLAGVIRFTSQGKDRHGQTIQPGVYTLRYGVMPANDEHRGAAPQRDFLLLIPAADDRDLNAKLTPDALVALSRKASGTSHPAVLSLWKAEVDSPGFSQQGDSDWVLQSKLGDTPVAIIVAGDSGG